MTEEEREPVKTLASEFEDEHTKRWGWSRMALRLVVLIGFLAAIGALYTVLEEAGVVGPENGTAERRQVFADVPVDHPQYDAIDRVVSQDIMQGDTDDLFNPTLPITRADFAEVVVNTMEWEVASDMSTQFEDVEARAFLDAADYIAVVSERGVMNGIQSEPPLFGPQQDLQTGHAIIVFVRASRESLPVPNPEMNPDIAALPYVAALEDALNVALANDLLAGTQIDPFEGSMSEPITRAQVAALAANVHDSVSSAGATSAQSESSEAQQGSLAM